MGSGEKKKKKQKLKNSEGGEGKRQMITDERFAAAQSDPRFMEAPKKRSKVSIDSRFNRVFTDKRFASSSAPTDKRGKPNNNKKSSSSLKHYYSLKQQEEEEKAKPPMEEEEKDSGNETETETESESEKSNDSLEEGDSDLDESSSTSSSDSDSDSDEQYVDEEEEDDTFLQPEDVPEIEQETRRLAVVNLDWGQVRAVDLYVLLSSFLPKGGQIISVSVYPSEFGLKRMAEEAVHGPVGLFDEEESEDEEDDELDNKKLRAYELSKLKYYYAVVECDSIATADHLYTTCDGVEFERSSNKLDLRFIPDSMDFKHDPRDVATDAPAEYEGLNFQTRALQHSNVELTWDEDEPHRAKTLKGKLTNEQLSELEVKEILASDESESEDDKKVNEYRALIQSGNASDEEHDDDNDHDMEVTFNSGLEDISKRILEKKDKKSETVWEAHLRKRKEKKKLSKNRSKYSSEEDNSDTDQEHAEEAEADDFFVHEPSATEGKGNPGKRNKRAKTNQETNQEEGEATTAELELLLAADDQGPDANLKGYNLKPKKGKGKRNGVPDMGKLPSAADYEDPRFASLFTSPLFALDPTDPQFKRSATYVRQVAKKQKVGDQERVGQMNNSDIPVEASRQKDSTEESGRMSKIKEKYELSSLVKSVKMKSKELASSQSQGRMRRSKSGK